MNTVYAEISDDGKKIDLYFTYDYDTYRAVKGVTGSKFVPPDKGGPYWTAPLDFSVAQELRKAIGDQLTVGDNLKKWGWQERKRSEQLQSLSAATDAKLKRLPKVLPKLAKFLRGYQRSGVAFTAAGNGTLIADQPGLGKTVQSIAGIFEADMQHGPQLVIAPIVSLESVWQRELERFQDGPVFVPQGSKEQRAAVVEEFYDFVIENPGYCAWLVVNPQMVAFRREAPVCPTCDELMSKEGMRGGWYRCGSCFGTSKAVLVQAFPEIGDIHWNTVIVDECHKNAVRNPNTLTAQAMFKLEADKRIAMSGTPIANRPIDLWGVLHFLHPEKFTSKWRWAYQWLEVTDNGYGKVIGNLREDRKEDFFRSLAPYVLRRTKGEVFSQLPPLVHVDMWAEMPPKQAKQYRQFAKAAKVLIDGGTLSATEVIVEYMRLKQFAIAAQELREGEKPYPTFDSGKLQVLEELLEERGIFDNDGTEKVIIFSQWERVVNMVIQWLDSKGVESLRLVGADNRKPGNAKKIEQAFQAEGGPRVIVMTTQTGGVSLTLDRADSCIFMDETWLDSEMEQAYDRLRSQTATRMDRPETRTFSYIIRTKKTIDEYIMEVVFEKGASAEEILDARRKMKLYD